LYLVAQGRFSFLFFESGVGRQMVGSSVSNR